MSAQEGRSARPPRTFIIHHDYLTEQDSAALRTALPQTQPVDVLFNPTVSHVTAEEELREEFFSQISVMI